MLELKGTIIDSLLEVMRYNEGYPMRTRKEIGYKLRICNPCRTGTKSRKNHHQGDPQKASAREPEDGAK